MTTPTPTSFPTPQACHQTFALVNQFGLITCAFGVVGLLANVCVLAVIFGYRKDLYYVRERIIAGLAVASALFASMCMVPMQYIHLDSCRPYIPFQHLMYLRMTWFAWKFAVVCYEIFIVAFSLYALQLQNPVTKISHKTEFIAHALCWGVALTILIYTCIDIEPVVADILQDDDDAGYLSYNEYLQHLNITYLVLFCVAILLFVIMRVFVLAPMRREWAASFESNTTRWGRDYWDEGSKSILENKKTLMLIQQRNFEEVAAPLERQFWVFALFFVPDAVLATSYCVHHSSAFAVCDAPTEMVLALRPIATALVYFMNTESRSQLVDYRRLWERVCNRVWVVLTCSMAATRAELVVAGRVRWPSDDNARVDVKIVEKIDPLDVENDNDDENLDPSQRRRYSLTRYSLLSDDKEEHDEDNTSAS